MTTAAARLHDVEMELTEIDSGARERRQAMIEVLVAVSLARADFMDGRRRGTGRGSWRRLERFARLGRPPTHGGGGALARVDRGVPPSQEGGALTRCELFYWTFPYRCAAGSWGVPRPITAPYVTGTGCKDGAAAARGCECCLRSSVDSVRRAQPATSAFFRTSDAAVCTAPHGVGSQAEAVARVGECSRPAT